MRHNVAAVAVDVSSCFGGPVSLAAVVDRVADVLSALLGIDLEAVPDVLVSDGWASSEGEWQALDRSVLENLIVGGPLSQQCQELAFTIHIDDLAGAAWLMITDHADDHEPSPEIVGHASPQRTCVGVVLAIAVVLGIGIASGGKLHEDRQIPMADLVEEPVDDPDRFIEFTRMSASDRDDDRVFGLRCERFLRQFPRLGGWPRDVSLPA
jgi:hypothetical protein